MCLTRSINRGPTDRKSTRLNSSHLGVSYAVFCLKKKTKPVTQPIHLFPAPTAALCLWDDSRGERLRSEAERDGSSSYARLPQFFFNDTATTEIYPLSLHDALPI